MPLKPYIQTGWSRRLTNVRIYLDDIEPTLRDFAPLGDTSLVANHKDGRLSRCEAIDDLIGRGDVAGLMVILVTSRDRERIEIEVSRSGIRVDVATNRHDI